MASEIEHQVDPEVEFIGAVNDGDLMRVERLLRDWPPEHTVKARHPKSGMTGLLAASMKGHTRIVEQLLQHRAPTSAKNSYGLTPLHAACKMGHAGIVQLLVNAGAAVAVTDSKGKTPSDYASALPSSDKRRVQIENTLLFGALSGGGASDDCASDDGESGDDVFGPGGDDFRMRGDAGFSGSGGGSGGVGADPLDPAEIARLERVKRRISMENHDLFASLLGSAGGDSPSKAHLDASAEASAVPTVAASAPALVAPRPRGTSETCVTRSGPRGVIEYLRARALDVPGIFVAPSRAAADAEYDFESELLFWDLSLHIELASAAELNKRLPAMEPKDIADGLKDWLKHREPPLIPASVRRNMLAVAKEAKKRRVKQFESDDVLAAALSPCLQRMLADDSDNVRVDFRVLAHLFDFLHHVRSVECRRLAYTLGPNLLPINRKSTPGEPPSLDDMQRVVLEAELVNLIMEVLIVCPGIAFGGPPSGNGNGLVGGEGGGGGGGGAPSAAVFGGAVSSSGTHSRRTSIDDMILDDKKFRAGLRAFYARHNPEKLAQEGEVDKIMAAFAGKHSKLAEKLERKYGVSFIEAAVEAAEEQRVAQEKAREAATREAERRRIAAAAQAKADARAAKEAHARRLSDAAEEADREAKAAAAKAARAKKALEVAAAQRRASRRAASAAAATSSAGDGGAVAASAASTLLLAPPPGASRDDELVARVKRECGEKGAKRFIKIGVKLAKGKVTVEEYAATVRKLFRNASGAAALTDALVAAFDASTPEHARALRAAFGRPESPPAAAASGDATPAVPVAAPSFSVTEAQWTRVVAENARLRTDLDALRTSLGTALDALQQRVVALEEEKSDSMDDDI